MQPPVSPVSLAAEIAVADGALTVRYRATNGGRAVVYLVNRLTRYEPGKGWLPDPAVTYVFLPHDPAPKKDRPAPVEIAKRVPPAPERLVTPRNYYVTPLAAGATFEETLTLPLPLQEARPYDSFLGPLPEPEPLDAEVRFTLGYFAAHPGVEAREVEVHGIPAVRLVGNPQAAVGLTPATEVILESPPRRLALQVVRLLELP